MNSCPMNVIDTIFKKKLELAGKALDCLPSPIRPAARELSAQVLTLVRDSLDQYLKNDRPVNSIPSLKKIDLE
jgi:hypothetical protein